MYSSSSYSYGPKHSPTVQKKMQYHSKGKSCGYYLRIVFFFSSLIQSLIIVSLVLFLIYGNKQDSASLSRVQDLEESFSRLSIENVALRRQRKNLTSLLNTTLMEKARNDWDLSRLRYYSNISIFVIRDIDKTAQQCNTELNNCRNALVLPGHCAQVFTGNCDCGMLVEQMKARIGLLEANCTQSSQKLKREMDQIATDRDNLNLEAIGLRRDKTTFEKAAELCQERCKTEFVQSLSGISNVTNAFLNKINSLFSTHMPFHITCEKQRQHLDRIQFNCTSLSREVEEKFQRYLDTVGDQVSTIQAENSRLKAENWRLSEDYRSCSQNRSGLFLEHKQNIKRLQEKHDQVTERLLNDKKNLNGEIMVLNKTVDFKNKEIAYVAAQLKQLNVTCMSRINSGTSYGSSRFSSSSNNGWSVFANTGAGAGTSGGSSSSSSSSSSNGQGSSSRSGTSSSSVYSGGSSSSSRTSDNKPGSNGGILSFFGSNPSSSSSSSGSSLSKPGQTGRSSTSSPYGGSAGTNLDFQGQTSEKSTTNAKSSSGSDASSSSSRSRFSWFGSSNSGSKLGSGTHKGPSGGEEDGGHPAKQHILELERLVNPVGSLATQ